jgi:hypothetical protein
VDLQNCQGHKDADLSKNGIDGRAGSWNRLAGADSATKQHPEHLHQQDQVDVRLYSTYWLTGFLELWLCRSLKPPSYCRQAPLKSAY